MASDFDPKLKAPVPGRGYAKRIALMHGDIETAKHAGKLNPTEVWAAKGIRASNEESRKARQAKAMKLLGVT